MIRIIGYSENLNVNKKALRQTIIFTLLKWNVFNKSNIVSNIPPNFKYAEQNVKQNYR